MFYLIKLKEHKVSLLEYDNETNSFKVLKKNGEEWQEFKKESFWQWFKKKISYDNETVSFVVISDEELEIDSSINIAKIHFVETHRSIVKSLSKELLSGTKLYFVPMYDLEKQNITKKESSPPPNNSLSEYYTNRTKLHKGI